MQYLFHSGNEYRLYDSLNQLCKNEGVKVGKDQLPAKSVKGLIIALKSNSKI
jgi:hypothetical protein